MSRLTPGLDPRMKKPTHRKKFRNHVTFGKFWATLKLEGKKCANP